MEAEKARISHTIMLIRELSLSLLVKTLERESTADGELDRGTDAWQLTRYFYLFW